MLRPFAWIGGAVATALLIAPFCSDSAIWILTAIAGALGMVALCIRPLRRTSTVWAVLFSISAALFFYQVYEQAIIAPQQQAVGERVSVTGTVCDLPEHYDNSTRYRLRIQSGDLQSGTQVYYYDTTAGETLSPGDAVRGTFTVDRTYDPADRMAYLYTKSTGVLLYLQSNGEDIAVTPADPADWTVWILRFRESIRNGLSACFTDPVAGTIGAVCFGDRDALDKTVTHAYRTTGLAHVLAVSGLHLTVVTSALYALVYRRFKPRVTACLSIGFVCVFMALTGFPASVVRAGVMTLVVLLGRLFYREADGFNSVGFAVVLIAIVSPAAVWDIGLQLSVCATIGLLEGYPRMNAAWEDVIYTYIDPTERGWFARWLQSVGSGVCVTACATLPTLVPMMVYYGEISLITPLANLVVVPLATVSVCLGLVVGLLAGFGIVPIEIVRLAALPTGLTVRLQHAVVDLLAQLPFTTWYIDGWYPVVWAVGVLLAWLVTRRTLIRTKLLAIGCVFSLCCGILAANVTQPITRRAVLAVGEDVAVCVSYRNYTAVLASFDQEDAVYRLQEALTRNRVHRVDALVLTDANGVGLRQLYALLNSVPVSQIYLPSDGEYLPELYTTIPQERLCTAVDEEPVLIGNLGSFTRYDGFIDIEWQGISVLIGYDPTASVCNVPPQRRFVHTAVYRDAPPDDAQWITAQEIVVHSAWTDETQLVRTTAYGIDCWLR